MKPILILLATFFLFSGFSQEIPKGAALKKTSIATTFENGDTLKHVVSVSYYDSLGTYLSVDAPLYDHDVISKNIVNTPLRKVYASIAANGDTTDYMVELFDNKGILTYNFQISIEGDTLIAQRWVHDDRGNALAIYDRWMEDKDYHLGMRSSYDDKNETIFQEVFDDTGGRMWAVRYDRSEDGKQVKCYKSKGSDELALEYESIELDENRSKTTWFIESVGYNYGIALANSVGGYTIFTSEKGELKALESYDKKGNLIHTVYLKEEAMSVK